MIFRVSLFVFLFTASLTSAQSFSLELSSDSILIGNVITLSYTAEDIQGDFEAPELRDMPIVSGPNTSTSMQIINGDMSSTSTYSLTIKPTDTGQYTIPPAYFISKEETLETQPIEINVYPNPDNIIDTPERNSNSFFFEFGDIAPLPDSREKELIDKQKKEEKKLKRI